MSANSFKINILSPERTLFSGEVSQASFPGLKAPFVVLRNHAPLISVLRSGNISWNGGESGSITISGGFVEVKNNEVTACVEV